MAWTTPLTAVANATLTAAQWNASVRDDLLETSPAKATAANRWFISTGVNAIAERAISSDTIDTAQTTASTSFADLATVGPAVTVTTGTAALVFGAAQMTNDTANFFCIAAHAISGATTVAASDAIGASFAGPVSALTRHTYAHQVTGLTAGSNTFTLKYRVSGGTGSFQRRHLFVMPL